MKIVPSLPVARAKRVVQVSQDIVVLVDGQIERYCVFADQCQYFPDRF